MKKVAFIIPGWGDSLKQKEYRQIAEFFKSKKIKPVLIEIDWKYKTMTDYVNQFLEIYRENRAKEVYLLGFSWGAMIGFISSAKIKPKISILCSLSPYFREDLKYLKKWWKKVTGKRRLEDLKNYSFNRIVKDVKCKTILLAGSREGEQIFRRVNDANNKLKNSELIIIRGAKHDISQREYQDAIKEIIYRLN
ncbi:MAG: hypothetical protein JSV92_00155 [archaeon]|nr:MAG: hypothetical protein JSV92_00155 [archaeon]